MNIIDIINKKRLNEKLTNEEINYVITNFVNGNIPDYQMSSLLMAICINGMDLDETLYLTDAMINSGDKIDLSDIPGVKVDKHSTGGIGDKVTLVVAPLVSSVGVVVPKMSGRGLGYTGGTIDKLESIEGFTTSLTTEEFIKQVHDIGIVVASQTGNLVPADKKIYALRDVSGTTESIPLIASSIMSKKIASGSNKIVIDLKVGNGALMKNIDDATKLAETMIKIGRSYNVKVVCVLSDMNQPLGNNVGNGLEVVEALEVLKGNVQNDVRELSLTIGSIMVSLAQDISISDSRSKLEESLKNGKALEKFYEFIKYQKGNINNIDVSTKEFSIKSCKTGFVTKIDNYGLGEIARKIGAGRLKKEDKIHYGVGFVLNKKIGDYVLEDEELIKVYLDETDVNINEITECFTIAPSLGEVNPLIYKVIE